MKTLFKIIVGLFLWTNMFSTSMKSVFTENSSNGQYIFAVILFWVFIMRKSSGVLSQTDSGSGGYRKARPRECEQNIVLEKTAAEQNVRKSWGRSWLGNENLRHSGKGGRASVFSTQFPDFQDERFFGMKCRNIVQPSRKSRNQIETCDERHKSEISHLWPNVALSGSSSANRCPMWLQTFFGARFY